MKQNAFHPSLRRRGTRGVNGDIRERREPSLKSLTLQLAATRA